MFGVAAIIRSGSEGEPTVPTKELVILTTSVSSTWSLNTFVNNGGPMSWSVSGGVTIAEQEYLGNDKPILVLSSNTGTARISIKSTTDFVGFTEMSADADKTADSITAIDLREATDLIVLSCKLHPNLNSVDVSTLVDLQEITLRDNNLTSVDFSNNGDLIDAYIYGNNLTSYTVSDTPIIKTLSIRDNQLSSTTLDQIVNDLDTFGQLAGTLTISLNPGSLTSDSYVSYNSLIAKGWTIDVSSPAAPLTGTPILSNFAVSNTFKDRVTFDSDKSITGMTATGFEISGKTLDTSVDGDGLVIDPDGLGGYFAVTVDFTWWDNNTIRLGENSVATNVNNKVNNFTLSYIDNLIDEPTATDENLYVTHNASGGTGTEVSPYTFAEAIANASAGTTIWVKAGDYGGTNQRITLTGTFSNPVKIIGYKTNPTANDITTNYYLTYGTSWSTSEMPSFDGTAGTHTFQFYNAEYIIFKNIQMKNGYRGIFGDDSNPTNYLHFERINADMSLNNSGTSVACLQFETQTDVSYYSHMRIKDSRLDNSGTTNVLIRGGGFTLLENVHSHTDSGNNDYSDYSITIGGSNNIVRECFAESHHTNKSSLHGIGIRSQDWLVGDYNLFELNTAINFKENLYVRNSNANYNVVKDSYAGNDGYGYDNDRGGMYVYACGDYNIFERIHVENCDWGIGFKDDGTEGVDPPVQSVGEYNIIRNCLINDCDVAIVFTGDDGIGSTENNNNSILNCTFDNNTSFLYEHSTATQTTTNFNIKNSIITNTSNAAEADGDITDITFTSNVFNGNGTWANSIVGTNSNVDVNPIYTSGTDWTPTQTFSLIDVPREPFVLEDYSRLERNATLTTVGAISHADETL